MCSLRLLIFSNSPANEMLPADTHVSGSCQTCAGDLKKPPKTHPERRRHSKTPAQTLPGSRPHICCLRPWSLSSRGENARWWPGRVGRGISAANTCPLALSANCSTFPPPPPLLGGLRHWSPLSGRRGGLCCPSLGGRAGRRGARGSRVGLPAALPDPAATCTDPAGGRTHFLRQRFQRRGAETTQAERSCRRCVRVTWGYPGGSSDRLRLWGDRRSLRTRLGTLRQTLLASRF